jgi:hypothetical protein
MTSISHITVFVLRRRPALPGWRHCTLRGLFSYKVGSLEVECTVYHRAAIRRPNALPNRSRPESGGAEARGPELGDRAQRGAGRGDPSAGVSGRMRAARAGMR